MHLERAPATGSVDESFRQIPKDVAAASSRRSGPAGAPSRKGRFFASEFPDRTSFCDSSSRRDLNEREKEAFCPHSPSLSLLESSPSGVRSPFSEYFLSVKKARRGRPDRAARVARVTRRRRRSFRCRRVRHFCARVRTESGSASLSASPMKVICCVRYCKII